ncbi:hypothetical protein [Streptomyces viridochromogenes]|uniref:hypothetical protein n=1 Tax=Streptomyces viridochromogenes TaxID=1938 RepID=UPI0018FF0B9A|nr:hypothetical protein [Streptomyces viridochromogenes]
MSDSMVRVAGSGARAPQAKLKFLAALRKFVFCFPGTGDHRDKKATGEGNVMALPCFMGGPHGSDYPRIGKEISNSGHR